VAQADKVLSNLTGHFLETTIPIGEFPVGKEHFSILTLHGDKGLGSLAVRFSGVFDGITAKIRWTLDGIEVLLIDTPWPVVMVVIVVMAVRLAGPRVGDFTAATLTDLAFMGLWAMSMITVALIGTGRFLCILFGIPLGIWFGKSAPAYRFAEPILNFMQTMPLLFTLFHLLCFLAQESNRVYWQQSLLKCDRSFVLRHSACAVFPKLPKRRLRLLGARGGNCCEMLNCRLRCRLAWQG
jgi:glycine betaine/proline transport system permease protein